MWLEALRECGAEARLTDSGHTLTVRRHGATASWRVRRYRRTPRPSEISAVEADWALWLPGVTTALRDRLGRLDITWVSDSGDFRLRTPWGLFAHDGPTDASPMVQGGALRLSAGTLATLQFLLEHPEPATQHRIAGAVGLSQARVSQVLTELRRDGLVDRRPSGWWLPDARDAFHTWLASAPAPDALTTSWYSLAAPAQQIADAGVRAAAEQAEIRLCGDWAADLLAPWRRPGLIVIHAEQTLDLEDHGFVPSPADAATLAVKVGAVLADWRPDPDVVAAMTDAPVPRPTAPVTEIAREISAAGGSDAAQAVDELAAVWLRARADVVSRRSR